MLQVVDELAIPLPSLQVQIVFKLLALDEAGGNNKQHDAEYDNENGKADEGAEH